MELSDKETNIEAVALEEWVLVKILKSEMSKTSQGYS